VVIYLHVANPPTRVGQTRCPYNK